ncbi:MAG: toll/interleukin-1 receptor domain-containing protein [Bacteroidia bacterium]|nr:toll/interleukin-1 receptor domain-containing protein [Bacteroidia bacterium]
MMEFSNVREYLSELVANGKTDFAIKEFRRALKLQEKKPKDLLNGILQLSARNTSLEKDRKDGILREDNYAVSKAQIRSSLVSYIHEFKAEANFDFRSFLENSEEPIDLGQAGGSGEHDAGIQEKTVFISYNHNDQEVARKIEAYLEAGGINVIRDEDSTDPGENLSQFSIDSVRNSDYTISLISKNSLRSLWVMIETLDNQFAERLEGRRKLIPTYLDKNFLNNDYIDDVYDLMEAKLKDVNDRIDKYLAKNRNTRHLNTQKTNLMKFLNEFDGIIDTLNQLRCMDLSEESFERSMEEISSFVLR